MGCEQGGEIKYLVAGNGPGKSPSQLLTSCFNKISGVVRFVSATASNRKLTKGVVMTSSINIFPLFSYRGRRALLLSRGDWSVFVTRGLSASLLAVAVLLLIYAQTPLMMRFMRDPVGRALSLSAFGVPLLVAGMMVSAWGLRHWNSLQTAGGIA